MQFTIIPATILALSSTSVTYAQLFKEFDLSGPAISLEIAGPNGIHEFCQQFSDQTSCAANPQCSFLEGTCKFDDSRAYNQIQSYCATMNPQNCDTTMFCEVEDDACELDRSKAARNLNKPVNTLPTVNNAGADGTTAIPEVESSVLMSA